MCERDFKPDEWGGIGFSDREVQRHLVRNATIVAVYIMKNNEDENKAGKFAGFVELSGAEDNISAFVTPEIYDSHMDIYGDEWPHSVGIKRAWYVVKDECDNWPDVDDIFETTYDPRAAIRIGGYTKIVDAEDFANIKELKIEAVEVYQPDNGLPAEEYEIQEYESAGALLISRGIPIE